MADQVNTGDNSSNQALQGNLRYLAIGVGLHRSAVEFARSDLLAGFTFSLQRRGSSFNHIGVVRHGRIEVRVLVPSPGEASKTTHTPKQGQ